jgi:anti-sigma B factor antagonist
MSRHDDAVPLECRVDSRGDTAYVAAIGELDIDTAPEVQSRLQEVRAAGFESLVLDLRGTTFIDSTGLWLALEWHERARRERFGFALIQGPEAVRRVIDVAGIRSLLNFVE